MKEKRNNLYYKIQKHIEMLGYFLIESPIYVSKTMSHVELIIHGKNGISTEDCTKVMKTMHDIIRVELNSKDVILSVSSPGLERKLKYDDEFALFLSKTVAIFDQNDVKYVGVIQSCDDKEVQILQNIDGVEKLLSMNYSGIKSAKLVFVPTKEIEETDESDKSDESTQNSKK